MFDQHPLKRPGDPNEVTFLAALDRGFSQEERETWADSPYVALLLQLHWRSAPPSSEFVLQYERGELKGFEAQAMQAYLLEHSYVIHSRDRGFAKSSLGDEWAFTRLSHEIARFRTREAARKVVREHFNGHEVEVIPW